jgi:RND family efflux transporter MFP subunit
MKKKLIIGTTVIALITATTFKLLSNKKEVDANIYRTDPEKKVLVQADTVTVASMSRTLTYTGTLIPEREVTLVPQVRGDIKGVYFQEGDFVAKGKILAQVDDELLQAQFIAVQANYETAQRNLERYENASQGGGISQFQLDTYRLNLKNAESQLKQLSKQIRQSRIEAPFAGTITFKDAEPGALAGNSPIARVTDLSSLKLEISVPETEIHYFREGALTTVEANAENKSLAGTIDYVSDRADQSHNYTVKIRVQNEGRTNLKAGMYGTASVITPSDRKAVTIPRSALIGSAKEPQVFLVRNKKAELINIKTGESNGEAIEITAGVTPGDVVVTGGQINLVSGSNVEIAH